MAKEVKKTEVKKEETKKEAVKAPVKADSKKVAPTTEEVVKGLMKDGVAVASVGGVDFIVKESTGMELVLVRKDYK